MMTFHFFQECMYRVRLDTFFKHENHAWPPSLALNGIMHQTHVSNI